MRFWPEPKRDLDRTSRFISWPKPFKTGGVGVILVNLGTPDEPTDPQVFA